MRTRSRILITALALGWLSPHSLPADAAAPDPAAAAAPAATSVLGSDAQTQDIFNFFQKEAEVYVVSKTKGETVADAPGTARVWTRQELEGLGITTLKDLINLTSGYSVQQSFGQYGYNVRGQASNIFNNNGVLLMIDGIPVNTARANRAFNEQELPLIGIERVEVLKGPSSALYGTGAFLGVINVVTRHLDKPGQIFDVKISASNPTYASQVMADGIIRTDSVQFKLLAGYYDRGASGQQVLDGLGGMTQYQDQLRTDYLNTSLELVNPDDLLHGLKVGAILMDRTGGYGVLWNYGSFSNPIDTTTFRNFIPYLDYHRDLTDDLGLEVTAVQQFNDEYGLTTSFPNGGLPLTITGETVGSIYDVPALSFQGKAELTWKLPDDASLVAGVAYDERQVKGSPDQLAAYFQQISTTATGQGGGIVFANSQQVGPFETWSGYLQAKKDWDLLAGLDTIVGVRYDQGLGFNQFSPRLGVVQKLTGNLNLKLLYGSALIAPGTKELDQNQQAQAALGSGVTVPNVQAERSQSLEGALVWHQQQLSLSADYFYMVVNNLFNGATILGQNIVGNNPGNNYSRGVELEADYMLADAKLFASFTGQEAVDNAGVAVPNTPTRFGNVGGIYRFERWGTSIGSTLQVMGDVSRGNPAGAPLGYMLPGYTLWNVNLTQRIATGTSLELAILNAGDASYGLAMNSLADAPQPRRTWTASISSKF